jgi:hypothetical protein
MMKTLAHHNRQIFSFETVGRRLRDALPFVLVLVAGFAAGCRGEDGLTVAQEPSALLLTLPVLTSFGVAASPHGIAIPVADFAATKERMTAAIGMRWLPELEVRSVARNDSGQSVPFTARLAFSCGALPLFALEQLQPEMKGFDPTTTRSPTRFFYFVPDARAVSARLTAASWPLIWTYDDGQPAGTASRAAIHEGPGGLLLEVAEPQGLLGNSLTLPSTSLCGLNL